MKFPVSKTTAISNRLLHLQRKFSTFEFQITSGNNINKNIFMQDIFRTLFLGSLPVAETEDLDSVICEVSQHWERCWSQPHACSYSFQQMLHTERGFCWLVVYLHLQSSILETDNSFSTSFSMKLGQRSFFFA